jgi:hypothetical protein
MIERFFGMHDEKPESIQVRSRLNGESVLTIYTRDYGSERKSLQTETSVGWPMPPCNSSGVQPEQAQELRDHFKKHGVPTEVTKQGDPIYRTPTHQKRALACRGMHNKAAI